MSVQPRYPLEVAHALSTLERASRTLEEIADRLSGVRAASGELLAATDWQTASARHFHRRAEGWQDDLDVLRDAARQLREEVHAMRDRALADAWRAGV